MDERRVYPGDLITPDSDVYMARTFGLFQAPWLKHREDVLGNARMLSGDLVSRISSSAHLLVIAVATVPNQYIGHRVLRRHVFVQVMSGLLEGDVLGWLPVDHLRDGYLVSRV